MTNKKLFFTIIILLILFEFAALLNKNIEYLVVLRVLTISTLIFYYFKERKTQLNKIDFYFFMAMLFVLASQFVLYFKGGIKMMYIFSNFKLLFLIPILLRRRIIFLSGKTPKKNIIAFVVISLFCLFYYGNYKQTLFLEFDSYAFAFSLMLSFVAVTSTLRQSTPKSYYFILAFVGMLLLSDLLITIFIKYSKNEYIYFLTRPIFILSIIFLICGIIEDRKYVIERGILKDI